MKNKLYGSGKKPIQIYLIAPKHIPSFWSLQEMVEIFGAKTIMPNSALATLMALTPPDVCVEYKLCDENVEAINFETPCDIVAVTGWTMHAKRLREIIGEFKRRGVKTALGGAYSSICREECEGLADFHFIGEAEYTWPLFLREYSAGAPKAIYEQPEYIDMKDSPPPDWSLINPKDYLNMTIQTSRGCPHNCEFCDVVQYIGHRFRTKPIENVIKEIENIAKLGHANIFFSDDNFIGNKSYVRKLLEKVIQLNVLLPYPASFATQITLNVADDEELLKMFADARFNTFFLGVETVRKESLEDVNKGHNLAKDLKERLHRINRYGILSFVGLIVGFDHDDPSVFGELISFLEEVNCPITGISLLNAPAKTPLHNRLKSEGRLVSDNFSGEWQYFTNIIPKLMSREELIDNYIDLYRKVYDAGAFERRMNLWLNEVEYFTPIYINRKRDYRRLGQSAGVLKYFLLKAKGERKRMFFRNLTKIIKGNPKLIRRYLTIISQYQHFYQFVNEELVNKERFSKSI